MSDMRLYIFNVGTIRLEKGHMTAGKDMGKWIEISIPAYLITHPKGNVLFDTGMSMDLIDRPKERWGDVADVFIPIMEKGQDIVSKLAELGYVPDDIDIVINSHLHLDHAGNNEYFPKAKFIVQREEIRTAYYPEIFQRAGYFRADFDHPLNYFEIEGDYDVFDDGKIICMFTPGHTQGHQSLLLTLENTGKVILPADVCHLRENLDLPILPGLCWHPTLAMKQLMKFRDLRDKGVTILLGHDIDEFATYKQAPEYYD